MAVNGAVGAVGRGGAGPVRGPDLVAATLARHAASLQAVARRHSLCEDDASDACQRALELFLRHADRLDPDRAYRWLHTVTKHEAITLRAERQRLVPREAYDFDREARDHPSPDDRALEAEDLRHVLEAFGHLKPAEAQALVLQADGRSYEEIARDLGWTRTKVNRCLAEGRARLRLRVAGIAAGEECERWAPLLAQLADGGLGAPELGALRGHLRACPACRAQVRALHEPPAGLAAAPVGLLAFWIGLQERALGLVVRGQAVLDALTSGKAVAVAASAAAVASGGVAAVDRALDPPSRAVVGVVRSAQAQGHSAGAPSDTAPRPAGGATVLAAVHRPARAVPVMAHARQALVAAPAGRTTAPRASGEHRARAARGGTTGEFGPDASAARAPRAIQPRPAPAQAPAQATTTAAELP